MPPFICKVVPVTKLASSLAKYKHPLETSSTLPNRFTGMFLIILFFWSSVSLSVIGLDIKPGAIRLQVIPRPATSKAIDFVKRMSPDLVSD